MQARKGEDTVLLFPLPCLPCRKPPLITQLTFACLHWFFTFLSRCIQYLILTNKATPIP